MNISQLNLIHNATMEILADTGVAFHSEKAVSLFKQHGFKTDGQLVFPTEQQVQNALEHAPSTFTLHARNPVRDIIIGGGEPALTPGYGAPHMITASGTKRNATLADYHQFCKLGHSSDVINVTGFLMVDPTDLPHAHYHLDMLLANISYSDQPFMGSPLSAVTARDALEMARIVFGDVGRPVMVSNVNALAPLQYAKEMAEALMAFAGDRQPLLITGGGIMGATAPMKIAGLMVVSNAAILAGIVLSQLAAPGAPVVYGTGGSPMDMHSGSFYLGSAEMHLSMACGAALARYYNLPCRSGGGLTDAHTLDFQAGAQSGLALLATRRNRIDFVLHTCGILGAYMAMNLAKFIADEELWRTVTKMTSEVAVDEDTIDLDTIREVGVGGQYLTHPRTFELCRTEFQPTEIMNRLSYDAWQSSDDTDIATRAYRIAQKRLEAYEKPDMDPAIQRDLQNFVSKRKQA
jgi:trimethylamine--corrinoid protein Co-methyltransferase